MEMNMKDMNQEYNDLFNRLGPAFASDPGFKNAQMYIQGTNGTRR